MSPSTKGPISTLTAPGNILDIYKLNLLDLHNSYYLDHRWPSGQNRRRTSAVQLSGIDLILRDAFIPLDVNMTDRTTISDPEWRRRLTREQYRIMRQCGTEMAFTGEYYLNKRKGTYLCAACGAELFSSDTKYDSGSGWPSFYLPARADAVDEVPDDDLGMRRTEVRCSRCGGHLGHVFDDGPLPTGLRYCINSASLRFEEKV